MVQYTLILGTKTTSSWSLRGYLAVHATGVPFEEVVIILQTPDHRYWPDLHERILRYSPAGHVPVLKIAENGQTLTVWDSLAICETMAERHPEAHLWPEDAGARAEARAYAAEMHSGFAELRAKLPMDFGRRHPMPEIGPALQAEIDRIRDAWASALGRSGGPFLFGAYSIADILYAPVVTRFLSYGVPLAPELAAYCAQMMAVPGMQAWADASRREVEAGLV